MTSKLQQNEDARLMEHPKRKSKGLAISLLVGVLVFLIGFLIIDQMNLKLDFSQFLPKSRQQSQSKTLASSSSEVSEGIEEATISESNTPFNWTYEDYQGLEIGRITMAEIEAYFGSANRVNKEGDEFRNLTYQETRDIKDDDNSPLKSISLSFEKHGDEFYLTSKGVENMVFPFEPAPEDQQVYKWTKELFDELPLGKYDEVETGPSYEEIIATYGLPHRLTTEEFMTRDRSRKDLVALYSSKESESKRFSVYLSFKMGADGRYYLWSKNMYGFED